MAFRAVIFDLDGTLLDTLEDIADAVNEVLQSLGAPIHAYSAYRTFIGDGVATLFQRALPASAADPELNARCVAGFQQTYGQGWANKTKPYAGIPELLANLQWNYMPMAVLSNKPHSFTLDCIQHFFPSIPFHPVLGQRPDVPKKPDPAGVHEILAELQCPAEQCCYVGDSSVDMQTARRAGVLAVGATWGFRSAEELHSTGAQQLIDRPQDLLPLLV